MRYGWVLGLALLLGGTLLAPAQTAFKLGMARADVLKGLGKPTLANPPEIDGREVWYYRNASVTFLNGQLISWRNFDENIPETEPNTPIHLGSSKDEVIAALGFPPTARLLTALVIGRKAMGEEEWTYSVGTLIFLDGLVMGWRDIRTPVVSLGDVVEKTKAPEIGSPASDLIAAYGSPNTLYCYVASGDQVWAYPKEIFVLTEGRITWRGTPKSKETPPARTTAPVAPTTPDKPTETQPKQSDQKGFVNNPDFPVFRVGYQTVLQQIQNNNPKFVDTLAYRAMQDCLNQTAWWSIKGNADVYPEYAQGVDMIYQAYQQFVAQKGGRL